MGDVPLRRKERLNLAAVALISEMLQVVFVSTAIWLFYVVLGALLVNATVRETWLLTPDDVYFTIAWFGDDVQVNEALLRGAPGRGLRGALLRGDDPRRRGVPRPVRRLADGRAARHVPPPERVPRAAARTRGAGHAPGSAGRAIRRNVTSFPSGNRRT